MTRRPPAPTPAVAAVPATTPFVAPEALARSAGLTELVRLGANESAFGPSPRAIDAMREAVALVSHYGDPESAELRAALAARHRCAPDEIVVGAGIDELLGLIVRTFLAPGETALATRGTYPTFTYHVTGFGGTLATVDARDGGLLDAGRLIAEAQRLRPRIVYVCNPDNPSGSFVERDVVAGIAAQIPEECVLLLDEAYADFVEPERLPADVVEPGVIRTRTFSKAYGMAGARIGYAIADARTIATFQKIRLHFGVNRTAQIGALAALDDVAFARRVVDEVARGRADYHALGARLGVRTLPSLTNFVCFEIGTRAEAEAAVRELLALGVFVRKPWAPPIDGFIRVTVGTPEERAVFAERFPEAVERVRAKATA